MIDAEQKEIDPRPPSPPPQVYSKIRRSQHGLDGFGLPETISPEIERLLKQGGPGFDGRPQTMIWEPTPPPELPKPPSVHPSAAVYPPGYHHHRTHDKEKEEGATEDHQPRSRVMFSAGGHRKPGKVGYHRPRVNDIKEEGENDGSGTRVSEKSSTTIEPHRKSAGSIEKPSEYVQSRAHPLC